MKKFLTLIAIFGGLNVSHAQNLVQDPGFEGGETGVLAQSSSPWYNPSPISDNVVINTSNPLTGNYNAVLTSQTGESARLLQDISLTAGDSYDVSFWLATPTSPGGDLIVYLNGVEVTPNGVNGVAVASDTVYTQYSFLPTPVASTGVLEFLWYSTAFPSSVDVDDVSVQAVSASVPDSSLTLGLLFISGATLVFAKNKFSAA